MGRSNLRCDTTVGIEAENDFLPDYFEVTVEWEFTPYDPGRLSGPMEDCYPPEGGELAECVVKFKDGTSPVDGEGWLRAFIGDNAFENEEEKAYVYAGELAYEDKYAERDDEWRYGRDY